MIMKNLLRAKRIALSHIDLTDDTYSISPLPEAQLPESFLNSIARVGILHPPIVKAKLPESFQVISGRKRLRAAKKVLALQDCDCLCLSRETPDEKTFMILLEERLSSGTITPVAQAIFITKVLKFTDEQQAAEKFLPLLGYPPHPFHIKRLLSLLELEEALIQHLHAGLLDDKTALELTALSFMDRLAIFGIIKAMQLSVGKQKKLLAVCRELAARHDCSIAAILAEAEITKILDHPAANTPQKAARLMDWLSVKKSPRLSAAEEEFRKFSQGLGLPAGAALTHSPNFEKDSLLLSLPFKNQAALISVWQEIKPALRRC